MFFFLVKFHHVVTKKGVYDLLYKGFSRKKIPPNLPNFEKKNVKFNIYGL
jgi:hypothetical protein